MMPKAKHIFSNLSDTSTYFLTAALTLLLLVVRTRVRFRFPQLWAEDGVVFLNEALKEGVQSLDNVYAGYFHTVSRIIALIGIHTVDFVWYPHFSMITCLSITAMIFATIVRKSYAWLIPSASARILICLLLCLVPGAAEVFGHSNNLHWILYFYLWLIALKPPLETFRWWENALILLFGFSTGEGIVVIPMIVLRLYHHWRFHGSPWTKQSWSDIYFLIVLTAAFIVNFLSRESDPNQTPAPILAMMHAILVVISQQVMLLPFLGPDLYGSVVHVFPEWLGLDRSMANKIIIGVTSVPFLAVIGSMLRTKSQQSIAILVGFACSLGIPVLMFIVRPGSIGLLNHLDNDIISISNMRYYFTLAPFTVLFWGFFLAPKPQSPRSSIIVALVLTLANLRGSALLFKIHALGKNIDWKKPAEMLQSSYDTGCPQKVLVPIYPEGWAFEYISPIECSQKGY